MSHILIVDDEPSICWGFQEFLSEDGHAVQIASSAEEGLEFLESNTVDVVVMDVRLPGMDGLTAIPKIRQRLPRQPIIVMTAFGNLEIAVQAMELGAFDYLPKPFDLEIAANVIQRALESLHQEPTETEPSVQPEARPETLIGSSLKMQQVFKQIALVAPSTVPVLITGESGTGKELVARAIHQHSSRSQDAFLPICLAALSPNVVESELFGHTKGAFTGATHDRQGLLEAGSGGTVFMDEIADTTPALQVKLLRAIEQQEVTPVGDSRPRSIQTRIVTATNRPIPQLIEQGEFREDFYFRLSVFHISLPPLRERREDIPLLAQHFLSRINLGQSASELPTTLTQETLEELQARDWPGNVRELRNVIEHAAIMARGGRILPEHLPIPSAHHHSLKTSSETLKTIIQSWLTTQLSENNDDLEASGELYEKFLALAEPPFLEAVLDHCQNNRAATAQLLGMHRTTLRQKLRKHGLDSADG